MTIISIFFSLVFFVIGQFMFFLVTVGTVILLNSKFILKNILFLKEIVSKIINYVLVATAMQQAALCSIIVKFPLSYISAFSSGMSLGGIFAAVALILTLIINSTPTKSTFLYFVFADITVLASFLGYLFIRQIVSKRMNGIEIINCKSDSSLI